MLAMESAVTLTPATSVPKPLHPNVVKAAIGIAVLSPLILLVTLIALMVATNYNILSWME